jgi:hypothetical protein
LAEGGSSAFRGMTVAASVWLPLRLSSSGGEVHHYDLLHLERGLVLGRLVRLDRDGWLVACWRACFTIAQPDAQCLIAKRVLALVAPPEKCTITQRGGRCPVAVLAPTVCPSSWPEWSKRCPAMVRLRWEQAEPRSEPPGRGEVGAPLFA